MANFASTSYTGQLAFSHSRHTSRFIAAHRGSSCCELRALKYTAAQSGRHPARSNRSCRTMLPRAMMDEGELVPDVDEGTKIKVTKEVTIYHAPKVKELQLNGMEGVVKNIVKKYKGKETSANLPYRIEFVLEKEDGKQQKFFAHMDASEFEKID